MLLITTFLRLFCSVSCYSFLQLIEFKAYLAFSARTFPRFILVIKINKCLCVHTQARKLKKKE